VRLPFGMAEGKLREGRPIAFNTFVARARLRWTTPRVARTCWAVLLEEEREPVRSRKGDPEVVLRRRLCRAHQGPARGEFTGHKPPCWCEDVAVENSGVTDLSGLRTCIRASTLGVDFWVDFRSKPARGTLQGLIGSVAQALIKRGFKQTSPDGRCGSDGSMRGGRSPGPLCGTLFKRALTPSENSQVLARGARGRAAGLVGIAGVRFTGQRSQGRFRC